jgi:hypothetical protein
VKLADFGIARAAEGATMAIGLPASSPKLKQALSTPDTIDTSRFKLIHNPCFKRCFRTNKSISDTALPCIGYNPGNIRLPAEFNIPGKAGNPGIPVSHDGKNFSFTVAGKSTGYGMFPATPAHNEYFHINVLSRWQ